MALTTSILTGRFPLPDDSVSTALKARFLMTGVDVDGADVIAPASVSVPLTSGALPAGFALWRNVVGDRGTLYRVYATYTVTDAAGFSSVSEEYSLGNIEIGPLASYEIGERIANAPVAVPFNGLSVGTADRSVGVYANHIEIDNGSAASPTVVFSDANTGLFGNTDGTISYAVNGVEKMQFGASSVVMKDAYRISKDTVNEFRLVDYLHPDDLALAVVGTTAGQDVARVTAAIQELHDAAMAWWNSADARSVTVVYPAVTLLINDEMFSEAFASALFGMAFSRDNCRWHTRNDGLRVKCSGFPGPAVRTSGLYALAAVGYAVPKIVYRWQQGSNRSLVGSKVGAPIEIMGEGNPATDPVGAMFYGFNGIAVDAMFAIKDLRNHGIIIEQGFNSNITNLSVRGGSGYQPTEFGGADGNMPSTVTFSNVGATVTATESVFIAEHVGKWFSVAGSAAIQEGAVRAAFWAQIASVTDGFTAVLDAVPDVNVTGQTGSFASVTVSTTAGSNVATISAAIANSLVGRYISIYDVYVDGYPTLSSVGCFTITAHSGASITLSRNAATTRSDTAIVFSPMLYVGDTSEGLSDSGGFPNKNDDINLSGLWLENGGFGGQSSVQTVVGRCTVLAMNSGRKMHGASTSDNNYGGNFCAMMMGITSMSFDGLVAHSTHSPIWGKFMASGRFFDITLRGRNHAYTADKFASMFYLSPDVEPKIFRVELDMSNDVLGFPIAANNHVWERGGDNYAPGLVVSAASTRAPLGGVITYPPTVVASISETASTNVYFQQIKSDYALDAVTTLQKIFNRSANGSIHLPVGTYEYRVSMLVTGMSATSGNLGFTINGGGDASFAFVFWHSVGFDSTNGGNPATLSGRMGSSIVAPDLLFVPSTGTVAQGNVSGVFTITSAGSVIPSLLLPTATAAIVAAGSSILIRRIGDSGLVGPWT